VLSLRVALAPPLSLLLLLVQSGCAATAHSGWQAERAKPIHSIIALHFAGATTQEISDAAILKLSSAARDLADAGGHNVVPEGTALGGVSIRARPGRYSFLVDSGILVDESGHHFTARCIFDAKAGRQYAVGIKLTRVTQDLNTVEGTLAVSENNKLLVDCEKVAR
jgi:hypothetical protein